MAVTALGLLGACAAPGGRDAGESYSRDRTQEMFESAYGHVQAHFIEPVGMDTIALAGLNRLSIVDGRMQVTTDAGEVVLLKEGRIIDRFGRPAPDDPAGWAALTADVVERSRQSSPVSASTPADDIYTALMEGVVSPLDQYSRYEDPRHATSQREARDGFGGIGVTIRSNGAETVVVEALSGSPAAAVGLGSGDILTHADGVPLAGLSPEEAVDALRGRIGSILVLDVVKASTKATARYSVERVHIVPPTIVSSLQREVGILRIRTFNRRTSADLEDEVERLTGLHGGPLAGLVLDLRDNPGGLLEQAVQTADLFLDSGPLISTRGRHRAANSAFTADSFEVAAGVPLAILTNGRSASASEMLAAALQDRGRAVVIGSTTHGKGSVQNLQKMPNGGELIITWSRMVTPSGYVLDGLGVLPNICTSGPSDGETDAAALDASRQQLMRLFQDWRRYDRVDLGLAGTLRRNCPPSYEAPDGDLELALRLLLEPAAYAMALSPGTATAGGPNTGGNFRRRS